MIAKSASKDFSTRIKCANLAMMTVHSVEIVQTASDAGKDTISETKHCNPKPADLVPKVV